MSTLVEALPGVVAVLVVPGVLVLLVARVRMTVIEAVGLVPVCSIGAVWLGAEVCLLFGIPFAPAAFGGLIALLIAAIVVAVLRKRYTPPQLVIDLPPDPPVAREPELPDTAVAAGNATSRVRMGIALGLLGAAVLVGVSIWVPGRMSEESRTPPNTDAATHALLVERIVRTETIEPREIVVSDPRGRSVAGEYYPLAMHASLALASRMTGASPASLLTAIMVGFAVLVLPCGLFALTRMLVPDLPVAAGFAALFGQMLGVFPYAPFTWGGINMIVGMAMLPVILVVLYRAATARWSRRALGLSMLLVSTILSLYISVLLLLLVLIGLLLLERAWRERSVRAVVEPVRRLAIVGVGALVVSLPGLAHITGGVSERSDVDQSSVVSTETALRRVLDLAYGGPPVRWLVVLALAGMAVMLVRRRLLAWALGAVVVAGLAALADLSEGSLSRVFTTPWYHHPDRIASNLVYFVPVFAGVALALLCDVVGLIDKRRTAWLVPAAAVVVSGLVFVLRGNDTVRTDHRFVQSAYRVNSLVGPDQLAAFDFLARRAPRDGLVVTDSIADGNVWMYSASGAHPMFGALPADEKLLRRKDVREREFIKDHLLTLGSDPKLEALLQKYDSRYVYYGTKVFVPFIHSWSLAQLRGQPRLREVFRRGTAHVFEILPPDAAPAGGG